MIISNSTVYGSCQNILHWHCIVLFFICGSMYACVKLTQAYVEWQCQHMCIIFNISEHVTALSLPRPNLRFTDSGNRDFCIDGCMIRVKKHFRNCEPVDSFFLCCIYSSHLLTSINRENRLLMVRKPTHPVVGSHEKCVLHHDNTVIVK